MILRYSVVVLASAVLATVLALSVSAVGPEEAEAAGSVRTCGGGKIKLNAKEESTSACTTGHARVGG